jgi:hypothetical protein
MSNLYTIELYTPAGVRLADISGLCVTRTYTVRRNRAEDIYLTLNLKKAQQLAQRLGIGFYQLFATGITEVRITRGSRPMVGGQLQYVHPRLAADGATLELRASGFLDRLGKVYLEAADTRSFTTTDMGQIAWSFIDQAQDKSHSNLGITQGTIQTSRNITDTWEPYSSSLKDIVIGLTERLNGIDFEFTPDKVFNVYYPGVGTDKTELLLSYPGNITSIGLPQDATTLANVVYVRGSGNGDVQLLETRQDADSQASYSRREQILDFPSISVVATLQEKGDETLRLYATPMTIPVVVLDGTKEPFLGSYWIGDRVRFAVDTDRYPAFAVLDGQTWRINEIACSIDESDHEAITLKVGYS